jgi:hypothetical protein
MSVVIKWTKVPHWYKGLHIGYIAKPGLFRVRYRGEVVAIGQAAAGLAKRMQALAKGNEEGNAAHLIYKYRSEITFEVAVLDLGDYALNDLRNCLMRKYDPSWNKRISKPRGL